VRPDSYIEINNFYTPTIYEKGAEICGMLQTLLGVPTFRAALGLYFERHDGEAATVEDFLRCMSEASGRDLQHFSKWYEQAGTPIVDVATHFSASDTSYTVTLKQHTPATPGQDTKIPLHMPLGLALLNSEGVELPLLTEETIELSRGIFEFTSPQSTLTFRDVKDRPILSINRGFSAPIILRSDATDTDLLLQMARDTDGFNRWEAAQTCARRLFVDAYRGQRNDILKFAEGLSLTLTHPNLDQAFKALMLQMPSEADVTVALAHDVDATQVYTCRTEILQAIATALEDQLLNALKATTEQGPYKPDTAGCATRSLRSAALSLLSYAAPKMALQIAQRDFSTASNMTTKAGALTSVLSVDDVAVETMLTQFYDQHKTDPLLIDKWLALCAAHASSAADVERLISHPAFTFKTPNRVYALLGGFTGGNLKGLHAADGSGYRLLGHSIITLNGINPQVAARMANGFRSWSRYDHARRTHASAEMHKILHHNSLSNDVFEIISRTLQG
jgi:aminopeptidase N